MGRIDLNIPDDLEHKFKMEAGRRLGAQRGAFTEAVVQALRLWIRDGKGKKKKKTVVVGIKNE